MSATPPRPDVSIVGARFVSAGKHAIGDVVELSFGLPNGEHLSRIEAEVRWAKAESGRTICGATLRLDHRDAERDTLQAFIAEQAKLLRSFDALREGAPVVEEKVSKGTGQPDER